MSEQVVKNYVRSGFQALEVARELCVKRMAECRGCPNALESLSWTCKIREIPEVADKLIERKVQAARRPTGRGKVTPAIAWDILDMLAAGMTLKDIAAQVGVSAPTVADVRDGIRQREVHREWHAKHGKAAG